MKKTLSFYLVIPVLVFTATLSCCISMGEMADKIPEPVVQNYEIGDTYTVQLESAPFPHPERGEGYSFEGKYYPYNPHYNRPNVFIYKPHDFDPKKRVDLVFFFHGMHSSIESAPFDFGLLNQFNRSGVNALFVMPETAWNAPDAFGGKLEEEGGFKALVNDVIRVIRKEEIVPGACLGRIVIVGHSGAWRVISKVLDNGDYSFRIKAVCLFDSLFAGLDLYAQWIPRPGKRFIAFYTENGRTQYNSYLLVEKLLKKHIFVRIGPDNPEDDTLLKRGKIVFIRSPFGHYEIMYRQDQFKRFLENARLKNRS